MPPSPDQPIGVCAILRNRHGQVLLGKRKNSYQSGMYGLPGGRIELNEPLEAAIQREVFEETGIEGIDFTYLGVVRENQGNYDFVHCMFVAEVTDQTPQLREPDKCEDWEWVDLKNAQNVLPGHQAGLELFETGEGVVDLTR